DSAGGRRRSLRSRSALGDPAGRFLPDDREADLPHGAFAPPFRARRLGGVPRHHSILDRRDPVRRPRPLHAEVAVKTNSLPRAVAILGFARSGRSLARALRDRGVAVSIGDAKPESEFPDAAGWREKGIRLFLGGPSPLGNFLEGADWLVLSPGAPLAGPVPREAHRRGLEVLAELEVAWRLL